MRVAIILNKRLTDLSWTSRRLCEMVLLTASLILLFLLFSWFRFIRSPQRAISSATLQTLKLFINESIRARPSLYEVKSYRQKYISRPSAGDFYLTVCQVIPSPSPNFLAGGMSSFAWLQTMETWNETLKLAFFKGSGEAWAENRRVTEEPWKMRCQNALLCL